MYLYCIHYYLPKNVYFNGDHLNKMTISCNFLLVLLDGRTAITSKKHVIFIFVLKRFLAPLSRFVLASMGLEIVMSCMNAPTAH